MACAAPYGQQPPNAPRRDGPPGPDVEPPGTAAPAASRAAAYPAACRRAVNGAWRSLPCGSVPAGSISARAYAIAGTSADDGAAAQLALYALYLRDALGVPSRDGGYEGRVVDLGTGRTTAYRLTPDDLDAAGGG